MKLLRKIAGVILRRLQNMAIYRRLGRRASSGILVREATNADRLTVQRWFNSNGASTQEMRQSDNTTDWIAEYRGQIAGFVQLVRNPPESSNYSGYWLFSLYTKPLWQGLGIGEMLSHAVVERARTEGASILDLVVYEDNYRAIRLYRKFGFKPHTIPELESQLEGERALTGHRRVVMRKQLNDHP